MRKIRRITAVLCVMAMLLSILPFSSIMADDSDEDGQVAILASEPKKGLLGAAPQEELKDSLLGEFRIHLQGRERPRSI